MEKIKNFILTSDFPPLTQSHKSIFNKKKPRIASCSTQTSNSVKKHNVISLTERNITTSSNTTTLKNFLYQNTNYNNSNTFYQTEIKPTLKRKLYIKKKFLDDNKSQKYVKLNRIFGFKETKKKEKINFLPDNPIGEREDYRKNIFHNALLSYKKCKASIFAHQVNVDYLISDFVKTKLLIEEKHNKLVIKAKEYSEYLNLYKNEFRDEYTDKYLESLNILRKVKKMFLQDYYGIDYLDDENFTFLKKYENRINFGCDCYHVPIFKNRFMRYNKIIDSEFNFINELDCPNVIDFKVWKYLNMTKIKIQKFKDMNIKNKNLIKNFYFDIFIEKKDNKKKKNDKYSSNYFENEMMIEKEEEKNAKKYDLENYFIYKKNKQTTTRIANDRLRNFVFTKFTNK